MRILVAGATGALGVPVVRLLAGAGHAVTGLTRSESRRAAIERLGAQSAVGDVLDAGAVMRVVAAARPEAIVSLLTRLPKRGPTAVRHMRPNARVHREGTANIVAAARAHGVGRIVAESVMFRYGYGDLPPMLAEDAPPGAVVPLGRDALEGVLALEDSVLGAGGIVLRFGLFYGPAAGHVEFLVRMLRRRMMRVPGGDRGSLSWIHLDDAAAATVAALERGRPGEAYNVADDTPASFAAFAREIAAATGAPPPGSLPSALARRVMPYATLAMTGTVTISNAKARRELGWAPRYPSIREGIASFAGLRARPAPPRASA